MPSYADLILASGAWIWLPFVFAFGACVGSLTNVLVYRLPLGMSVVTPASRCPACGTKLTWRENIPVFGWLLLRGRCRFCKSRISPEYPLVEAGIGLLFVVLFVLWYSLPQHAVWLGVDWGLIRPDWARMDAMYDHWPRQSWPAFVVLLVLAGSLAAMSLVDIKTYTIPLQIPWFATVVGLVFHVGYAAVLSVKHQSWRFLIPVPFEWPIMTPRTWASIGAALGGVVGLGLANVFLHKGWLRRSFADYAEWEATHLGDAPGTPDAALPPGQPAPVHASDEGFPWFRRLALFVAVCLITVAAVAALGSVLGDRAGWPRWMFLAAGAVIGPLVAALAIRARGTRVPASDPSDGSTPPREAVTDAASPGAPADMWIQYPHARREMVKEILFLTPAIALAWLGAIIAPRLAAGHEPALWLRVLGGVLLGYLIGGGVVWAARILGSLGFAKEALGLGDVHLMAAVGACAGWPDAVIAFPLAAVVGLYWVIVHALATGRMPRAMQFGPYLAMATMLVILGKPVVETGLTSLFGLVPPERINLP